MHRRRDLTVEQFMTTAVIAVKPGDSIDHARKQMELASIRHLPVVDERNHVLGILSNRDVLRALGHRDHGKVSDYMTVDVVTVLASHAADEAAARMLDLKIGSLPVVADDGELIGVVTETDFLLVAVRALRGLDPAAR